MINRRPIFTVVSMLVAIVFAVGSRPLLIHSIERQSAEANLNSADAVEDSGRMAGFALIAGQVISGGIGAAVGVVLAAIGFWRRERWQAVRWCSLVLNLAAAGLVGFSVYPLWRSQHHQAATEAETGAGNVSNGICCVMCVSRSQSSDPPFAL
jgi:uncharacterized membrane protein